MDRQRGTERLAVLAAAGALGFSAVATQLALMREVLGSFAGNEMVLGIVLGLWLLLMGGGAWLGRWPATPRRPWLTLAALEMVLALLPLFQVFLLRVLRNVVFLPGSVVGVTGTTLAVGVLLLPYCVAAGFALTLACRVQASLVGPSGIGQVYVADSVGSVAGGAAFCFVLACSLDHLAILIYPAELSLAAAAGLALAGRIRWLGWAAIGLGVGLAGVAAGVDLDAVSAALQYPRERILARANSPYGRLLVTESAGQINFLENGVPLTSSREDQHTEETVHYALAQRPAGKLVLLIGGGISGTAREVLKYPVRRVDYVELDPMILELGRKFAAENLADSRIRLLNTDGRLFLGQTREKYDVVIIDVPAPSTAQLNRFYTAEFFSTAKRVLAEDGVVSFALGQYENYVSPQLARLLASTHRTLKTCFANVRVIPGGRVFFLGSDGPLSAEIAARLAEHRIATKLVRAQFLEAKLSPDRLADIERAVASAGSVNHDFKPVLYYYYLRHWLSQFNSGWGVAPVAIVVLCGLYLASLRGAALVLFASGFAASSLEFVLLLTFQIVCGSVYHQVGLIVTVFMGGLALGAWLAGVPGRACAEGGIAPAETTVGGGSGRATGEGRALGRLGFLVGAYAVVLPLMLPLVSRLGITPAGQLVIKGVFALLTLGLAVLVGMQFPLANRLEFRSAGVAVSRLYTADFAGAFFGALLASTLLLPLLGLAGVCWVAGLLNLVGAAAVYQRGSV